MTLQQLFRHWCEITGYFPDESVYVRDSIPLHANCARIVRMHSPIDAHAGHAQHYVIEARTNKNEIVFPFGQDRRDLISMEAALHHALKTGVAVGD